MTSIIKCKMKLLVHPKLLSTVQPLKFALITSDFFLGTWILIHAEIVVSLWLDFRNLSFSSWVENISDGLESVSFCGLTKILMITNSTILSCFIAFLCIPTGCHMAISIQIIIRLILNAWCLNFPLSEHRIYSCRSLMHVEAQQINTGLKDI